MAKTIWKFQIPIMDQFILSLHEGAEILTVQEQFGDAFVYALIDVDKEKKDRIFQLFGTGHLMYDELNRQRKYIGTVQLDKGNFVYHLFEVIRKN
jgi:hypothetical protein